MYTECRIDHYDANQSTIPSLKSCENSKSPAPTPVFDQLADVKIKKKFLITVQEDNIINTAWVMDISREYTLRLPEEQNISPIPMKFFYGNPQLHCTKN